LKRFVLVAVPAGAVTSPDGVVRTHSVRSSPVTLFTPPERAERAMKAMLGMKKIDVAALEAAADGV
jgi:hypothetical protein